MKTKAVRLYRHGTDRARAAPKTGRVYRRKLRTRQALIDATHSLLASRSIDALSVDEIARRADVAKGTFYNYFADKSALARELAANVRARLEEEITCVNAQVADPAVRIARALTTVIRSALRDPQQAMAMMRLFPHATDPSTPLNTGVRGDVLNALARKRIVAPSVDVVVVSIVGIALAGVNRVLDLTPDQAARFTRELGIILLHGLGLRRPEAARIMAAAVGSMLQDR